MLSIMLQAVCYSRIWCVYELFHSLVGQVAMKSYTYHYWSTYGSPEIEQRSNDITAIDVSEDGLTVRLTVPKRETGRVFQLSISGLNSQDGDELLHPQAWYTLNAVPDGE